MRRKTAKRRTTVRRLFEKHGFRLEQMGGNLQAYVKGRVVVISDRGGPPLSLKEPIEVYPKGGYGESPRHFNSSIEYFGG